MVQIRKISADKTYQIRLEILRNGMDLPVQFSGDFDKETFHLGVFEDGNLKGIASFMKTTNDLFELPQYQLRGMATLEEVRGKGLGKQLLIEGINILRDRNVRVLWCNAREVALNFYEKLEFSVEGNSFEIPEIGKHYIMYKKI